MLDIYGGGAIENCRNTGAVSAPNSKLNNSMAGGIAGWAKANGPTSITNCINSGPVTSGNKSGGVVGQVGGKSTNDAGAPPNAETLINECTNVGTILTDACYAGGLVGGLQCGVISSCSNAGSVTTSDYTAGGIVGGQEGGSVTRCNNSGPVTAQSRTSGGISGWLGSGIVENCANSGVTCAICQRVGGVVGLTEGGSVTRCSNSGTIISKSETARGISGGAIGVCQGGTVDMCYNIGKVQTGNFSEDTLDVAGGVVGLLSDTGSITKSYSSCEIEGGDVRGGVIGQFNNSSTASVSKCYYTSEVEGLNGIGSKGADNTVKVEYADQTEETDKVDRIESYEKFTAWIQDK